VSPALPAAAAPVSAGLQVTRQQQRWLATPTGKARQALALIREQAVQCASLSTAPCVEPQFAA
jgi:hypothetical protein